MFRKAGLPDLRWQCMPKLPPNDGGPRVPGRVAKRALCRKRCAGSRWFDVAFVMAKAAVHGVSIENDIRKELSNLVAAQKQAWRRDRRHDRRSRRYSVASRMESEYVA